MSGFDVRRTAGYGSPSDLTMPQSSPPPPPEQERAAPGVEWPDRALADRAPYIGVANYWLLTNTSRWIHRRVETIHLLGRELARRNVSIDFEVPLSYRPLLDIGDRQWVAPIAFMQRGELRGFDLRDEDDRALPLLRSAEQVAVNTMLLRFAASRENAPVTSKDIQRFEQLSSVSRSRSAHAFGELRTRGLAGELCTAKFPALASLLRLFRDAYTLLVVLDSLDGRRIVKFGYDEPLPQPPAGDRLGFEPARFELDAPGAVHTASYHAQVVLPELVRARVARLEVPRRNAQPEPFDDDPDSDRPALHPTRALPIDSRPQIRVELSTERAAFFSAALTVGVLSTGLLAAGAVLAWAHSLGRHDVVPPITIMLVASAVYPALVLTSDVRLLRQLLESGRLLLAVVALCSVAAAASLAFHAGYLDRGLTWSACTAVAALATGGLAQGWFAAYATIVE